MSRRLPPLNSLRAFEAAARHCSFRHAAEELHVTHSAISHQVKLLETQLQVALFQRRARSVELTDAGRLYFPVLRDALDRIADGTELVRSSASPSVLTIQVYPTFAMRWLIQRLPAFQNRHTDVQVRLNMATRDVDFDRDNVDVSVMMGSCDDDRLHYEHLFMSDMFPVCSPEYLRRSPRLHDPQDLRGHTLLQVYVASRDWEKWLEAVDVADISLDNSLRFDSYALALEAALDGAGISMTRTPFAAKELASGRLVRPFEPVVRADHAWYLTYRRNRLATNKIRALQTWLLEEVHADPALATEIDDRAPAISQ